MNVLFVNNTSLYHCGSFLTCKNLIDLIKQKGHFLELLNRSTAENMKFYDVIIINGEGSFHHNKTHPPAKGIYYCAEEFKKIGKKVFLINTVIQEIDYDLSIFDAIYTRESLSSQGKYPVVHDACFHTIIDNSNNKEEYLLFLDSVLPEVNKEILKAYENYNGHKKHVKMDQNKYNLEEFIDLCKNASFIVTGRYHGAVFSIMCEKKFIALESNTHKISGLLKDLDLTQNLAEDLNNLEEKMLLAKKPKIDKYKIKKDIEDMIDFCLK